MHSGRVQAKLALFGVLQVLALGEGLLAGNSVFGGVLQLLALGLPGAWLAAEAKQAQADVEYVICPFIDFLNHSSSSQVGEDAIRGTGC